MAFIVKFNKKVSKALGKQGFIKEFSKHFIDIDLDQEYDKMFPQPKKEKDEKSNEKAS